MSKKQTTIRIPKGRFQKRVPVSVNGSLGYVPVETDTPVGDHILEALNNAGVEYTVISSDGETDGSESGVGSEPSTVVIGAESPIDDDLGEENERALLEPEDAPGANEGDGNTDETPVETPVENAGETSLTDEQLALLDKSVPDLTDELAKIEDVKVIDALIAAEGKGKTRSTALAALNSRKEELAATA